MNYRHAYHAGNFADVFKHVCAQAVLAALNRKSKPYCYFETHAGAGSYKLGQREARMTAESEMGIQRLAKLTGGLPDGIVRYLNTVRAHNAGTAAIRRYPGSPWLAAHSMRAGDRLVLCELEAKACGELKRLFHSDQRIQVHRRDGYAALQALLPPQEHRGWVLIDPPYEAQVQEFSLIQLALNNALKRWPQGIFAVWYPIKLRRELLPFQRWLAHCGAGSVLLAELQVRPADSPLRMNGCGMAFLNPPWKLDAELQTTLPALATYLGENAPGTSRLEWLSREQARS